MGIKQQTLVLMKYLFNLIGNLLFVLIISNFLVGCNYYRHSVNTQKKKNSQFSRTQRVGSWSELEERNILVVHHNGKMYEISKVVFNESDSSISADYIEFVGAGKLLYEDIVNSNGSAKRLKMAKLRKANITRDDVKQIHFFLHSINKEDQGKMKFLLKDIIHVDATEFADGISFLASFGVLVLIVAIIGLVAIIVACGCPHVYANNDTGDTTLIGSLFTGATNKTLERHDYKSLNFSNSNNSISIRIMNEDTEWQYTDQLELIAVNHDPQLEVGIDKNGVIYTISNKSAPFYAFDNFGKNIMPYISDKDHLNYSFNSVSSELPEAVTAFKIPADAIGGKLILRLKNSPWAGIVFNEFNGMFGSNYQKWLQKSQQKSFSEQTEWMRSQGLKMTIDQKIDGEWQFIDDVEIVSEIAFNEIVVPIENLKGNDTLELRLRSGYLFWELDYMAMDFTENQVVEINYVRPEEAVGNDGISYLDQLSLIDEDYMENIQSGDFTDVKFSIDPPQNGKSQSLFLHSKGYYSSKKEYSGKSQVRRLKRFKNPAELSRFSQELYYEWMTKTALNE